MRLGDDDEFSDELDDDYDFNVDYDFDFNFNYEIYRFNIGRAFGSLFNKYAIRVLRVNPLFDNSIFCMDGTSIIQRW